MDHSDFDEVVRRMDEGNTVVFGGKTITDKDVARRLVEYSKLVYNEDGEGEIELNAFGFGDRFWNINYIRDKVSQRPDCLRVVDVAEAAMILNATLDETEQMAIIEDAVLNIEQTVMTPPIMLRLDRALTFEEAANFHHRDASYGPLYCCCDNAGSVIIQVSLGDPKSRERKIPVFVVPADIEKNARIMGFENVIDLSERVDELAGVVSE